MIYPAGIHFAVAQIIGSLALWLLVQRSGKSMDVYYQYAILLTGITGLVTMLPAWYFYRRDRVRRVAGGLVPQDNGGRVAGDSVLQDSRDRLSLKEGVLLLGMGAGFALYANFLMGILQIFFNSTVYQESMERITQGQSFEWMVLWMGIVAPIAEEMIFRWLIFLRLRDYMRLAGAAVISGLTFGIYHGNLLQAVYAGILGILFAYILEMSGSLLSSVLLHIGANVWSLVLSEYGVFILVSSGTVTLLVIYVVLLVVMIAGLCYFAAKGRRRNTRLV